jgi:hypothetical protein
VFQEEGGLRDGVGMQHLSSITGDRRTSVAVRWVRHRPWLRKVYARRSK